MSKYMKAGGGYELLLFFFHHASDQQLGKYITSNWSMNWSMTLSSLLEYLRSLVLIAVNRLTKMDWRSCKYNFSVLPEETGLQAKGVYLCKLGLRSWLCFYQPWCSWLPISWKVVWATGNLSRPSWHLHQQLPTLAFSLEKLTAASIFPSNRSVKVRELSHSIKQALKGGKAFKDQVLCLMNTRLWSPWWKDSFPSILILKKKRELKKTQTILKSCSTLHAGFLTLKIWTADIAKVRNGDRNFRCSLIIWNFFWIVL